MTIVMSDGFSLLYIYHNQNLIHMKLFILSFVVSCFMWVNQSCTSSSADVSGDEPKSDLEGKWYDASAEFLNSVTTNSSGETIAYPEGQATISSKFVVWKPGFETGIHKHPVPIAVAVYQGELTVEFENGETLVTPAGGAYVSTPDQWHKSSNKGSENLIFHLVYMGTDQVEHTVSQE